MQHIVSIDYTYKKPSILNSKSADNYPYHGCLNSISALENIAVGTQDFFKIITIKNCKLMFYKFF